MNPRIKHIAFGSSHKAIPTAPMNARVHNAETLRDEAALLLSIADICNKEMRDNGVSMLWDDEEEQDRALFPKFPTLTKPALWEDVSFLKPRSEAPRVPTRYSRPRAVSMDSGRLVSSLVDNDQDSQGSEERSVSSPIAFASPYDANQVPIVTPTTHVSLVSNRRLPMRKSTQRMFKKAKRDHLESGTERIERPPVSGRDKKGKALQGIPPKGVPIKKIMRKKFSWKNYPEVSHAFLIGFMVFVVLKRDLSLIMDHPLVLYHSWNVSWWPIVKSTYATLLSTTRYSRSNTIIGLRMNSCSLPPNTDISLMSRTFPT